MRNRTYQKSLCLLVGIAFLLIPVQALAKDGWYMAMDLGVAVAPGPNTHSSDNDFPTTCDQFIDETTVCTDPSNETWTNKFDGGTGVLAGLAMGYRWQNFRVEGEYFYRNAGHDSTSEPSFGGVNIKTLEEISESEEGIDDLLSHNFFTNLYYDFTSDSKWTPYLGMGVGFAQVSLDYFNRFTRSSNPDDIGTFNGAGQKTDDEITNLHERLAGTTTLGRSKLSDMLFGYQAIAGVDYRISEPVTIGLKFRWVDLGKFKDGDEYRQLRSHDSTNSDLPGSARVRYQVKTDDVEFWGLSLNMKYHF